MTQDRLDAAKTIARDAGELAKRFFKDVSAPGWTWVIDPIDGTANFVAGIPQWCVILACVQDDATKIGVIFEPITAEMIWRPQGHGAFVNDTKLSVANTTGLNVGSVGVGTYERVGLPGRATSDLAGGRPDRRPKR